MEQPQAKHLVFYDGECGFCDCNVQFLLKKDKKGIFVFAPLQGKTADLYFKKLPLELRNKDTIILIEDYKQGIDKVYIFGKAVFRILWLLGGFWYLFGWISFLPSFLYDWGYRLVARNRHLLPKTSCVLPDTTRRSRFLE
jgi:predicted DCC family thiol-disulfide oxidoreductase YuxK